jgi:hypothetical protein
MRLILGTISARVSLDSDSGGAPDAVLESWTVTALAVPPGSVVSVTSKAHPALAGAGALALAVYQWRLGGTGVGAIIPPRHEARPAAVRRPIAEPPDPGDTRAMRLPRVRFRLGSLPVVRPDFSVSH